MFSVNYKVVGSQEDGKDIISVSFVDNGNVTM